MTTIKATCPCCGDVELNPDQVRLVVYSVADRSFYEFTCTQYRDLVRKPAGDEVVRLLTLGGIVAEQVVVPVEVLEHRSGPPITMDDVLDFSTWLSGVSDVAATAAATTPRRFGD